MYLKAQSQAVAMFRRKSTILFIICSLFAVFAASLSFAQSPTPAPTPDTEQKKNPQDKSVRTVTIPISIFTKTELKENQLTEFVEAGNIFAKEDGDQQVVLSIRSVSNTPLSLAILIQDDLEPQVNLELKRLGEFIKNLPKGSRVMIGYIRVGGLQVRQRFTEDLEKAANSLRIITGSSAVATNDPYDALSEALERFDGLPAGRRAVLFVSDGYDATSGLSAASSLDSLSLQQAIFKAQRRSAAVYSIYSDGSYTRNASGSVVVGAQGALNRLASETGGRAFFQGTHTPVSFEPFFRDLDIALNRQFALTYLSTHMNKGYHRVEIYSSNPDVKIEHPKGYRYRK
jgi:VWFA-related protein